MNINPELRNKKMKVMMRIFLSLLIVCMSLGVHAQSKRSDAYFEKGIDSYERGDYSKAIEWFSKAEDLDKNEIPKGSCRNGYCMDWIAYCYHMMGDDEKAKEYSKNYYFIKPIDRRLTVESDKEGDLLSQSLESGNLQEALSHGLKCIEIEEREIGKETMNYVGSCFHLANTYFKLKKYTSAISYCKKGLDALSSMGLEKDPYTFDLLQQRVYAYLHMNLLAMTYNDIVRLRDIGRYELEEKGNLLASASVKLLEAEIEYRKGDDIQRAIDLSREAFELYEKSYSPDNDDVFLSMLDCTDILSMTGQIDLITTLIQDALSTLREKGIKRGHEGILISYLGDFSRDIYASLKYYEEAESLLRDSEYEDKFYYCKCMIAHDYAYSDGNKLVEAIEILENVCQHYQKEENYNSIYIKSLRELSDIYVALGKGDIAMSKYDLIFDLYEDDKANPDYILTFFKWFPVCVATWDNPNVKKRFGNPYELITELFNLTKSIDFEVFKNYGLGVPQVAQAMLPTIIELVSNARVSSLVSLPEMERGLAEFIYQKLIPTRSMIDKTTWDYLILLAQVNFLLGDFEEAIEIAKQVVEISKNEGCEYRNYLSELAYYQYGSGDVHNAYENFRIKYDFYKENLLENFRWMTLDERESYTNRLRGGLYDFICYAAITQGDSRYAELGYDALLFERGLLLNSTIELNKLIQEEGDPEIQQIFSEWTKLNRQLQASEKLDESKIDGLKSQILTMERRLLEKSKHFGDYTKGLDVTYKDVQSKLQANDVAVEMFSYWKDAKTKQYGAIVMAKDMAPRYVAIGCDSDWAHIDVSKECYSTRELFDLMFGELKQYLPTKDKGNVYFVPDGIFHGIAIENLPGAEEYNLRRLSSTRELALSDNLPADVSSIVLFGDISYGLGEVASYYPVSEKGKRGYDEFLIDLPGTKDEVEHIDSLLESKVMTNIYMGKNATKSRMMAFSGSHTDILHVATHGFFDDTLSDQYNENPMTMSGLYFAGAQNTIWNKDTKRLKDNGILTSQEISMLDLRGLKLAVLSACETGLGYVNPDGVFGLQRGFKQAGAKAIMMSLWKVDDDATHLLMMEFYKNILKGENQYDALKGAQREVRNSYPKPEDWAAFVLIDANNNLKIK